MSGISKVLAIGVVVVLSGCSFGGNTDDDFLCEAQVGSPCTTIANADGVGIHSDVEDVATPKRSGLLALWPFKKRLLASSTPSQPTSADYGTKGAALGTMDGAVVASSLTGVVAPTAPASGYRVPELVGTLWIASRLDGQGLLHEASNVHFVARQAQWVGGRR